MALLVIVALGLGVRATALAVADECAIPTDADLAAALAGEDPSADGCVTLTDAVVYHDQALDNADGHWFQTPAMNAEGDRQPSALHPPLFPLYLTVFTAFGVESFDALRVAAVPLGGLTIALSALLGRRIAGDRAGLMAAVLVAIHPMVWINDVVLMSESLFMVTVPLVGWAAITAWERRDIRSAAWLGLAIGTSSLVRSEAILLVALVGLPVAVGWAGRRDLEAWKRAAVVAVAAAVTIAPWVGANLVRFNEPVLFTTTAGFSLRVTNCPEVYQPGPALGTRSTTCLESEPLPVGADQSTVDQLLVQSALEHVGDDPAGAALAATARSGRMWGVYRPFESIRNDEVLEVRGIGRSEMAIVFGWEIMAAGAYGAWLLRKRGIPISPLIAWVLTSTAVALINLGLHRFRASADVALCILAAVAVEQIVWGRSTRAGTTPDGRARPPEVTEPEGSEPIASAG